MPSNAKGQPEALGTQQTTRAHKHLLDHAALGASLLCLAHCLALPLLFAALPALGSVIPGGEGFHLWMLGFAVPASGWALVNGRKRHAAWWPLSLGGVGLVLLAIGVLGFGATPLETALTVSGAVLLAVAHIGNLRLPQPQSTDPGP